MAGSYKHVVNNNGNLRSNESFEQVIGNLGDAYEAIEEMYGMIWWLATSNAGTSKQPEQLVRLARECYETGLNWAERNKHKRVTIQ
jgi:hypothetical protein